LENAWETGVFVETGPGSWQTSSPAAEGLLHAAHSRARAGGDPHRRAPRHIAGMRRIEATFADAAAEFLR
jgi:hypothetical protein